MIYKKISQETWQSLRKVLALFIQKNARKMCLGIVMSAITLVSGLALLGLSGWFLTATSIAGMLVVTALAFDVFIPSATIRFLALARTVSRYAERLMTHDATLSILADLRVRLFRGWAKPQQARLLFIRPSQLLFRLTVDIDALDGLYLRVLLPASAALIVTVLSGITLGIWITPGLGVALVIWLILSGLGVPVFISFQALRAARMKAYALEALRARTIDLIAGQVDLLMANQVDRQCISIMNADKFLCQADQKMNKLEVILVFLQGVATTLMLVGTLLVCATLVQSLTLGIPMAAFALLVALAAFEPFIPLRRAAIEFGRTLLAVKRLAPQLDEPSEQIELPDYNQLSEHQVLKISQMSFSYPGTNEPLLKNISFELNKGQNVAIVGHSGSGKSTLLALIAQELTPDTGEIHFKGTSILTQRTELFQDTLRGNLLLANPVATDQQLWKALEDAGLATTIKLLPNGLESSLGEGGLGLSTGQARRLALARLLLRNTPLWLLDEPTEGLDTQTADEILKRVLIKSEQKALLIATHLQREAILADMIFLIDRNENYRFIYKGTEDYKLIISQLKT